MSKQIRNLGVFLALCYTALFLQVNRLTVFEAQALQDKPENTRQITRDFSGPRGDIVSADGVLLAESVPADDQYLLQRTYPTNNLFGHVTGHFAFQLGTTGVERSYNGYLNGKFVDIIQRNVDRGALITAGSPADNTAVSPSNLTGAPNGLFADSLGEKGSGAETIDGMLLFNARKIVEALK